MLAHWLLVSLIAVTEFEAEVHLKRHKGFSTTADVPKRYVLIIFGPLLQRTPSGTGLIPAAQG